MESEPGQRAAAMAGRVNVSVGGQLLWGEELLNIGRGGYQG